MITIDKAKQIADSLQKTFAKIEEEDTQQDVITLKLDALFAKVTTLCEGTSELAKKLMEYASKERRRAVLGDVPFMIDEINRRRNR